MNYTRTLILCVWFLCSIGVAARDPTPKTEQFLAWQAKQGVKNADKVTRVWHMAYIQDPDMSKKKQKKLMTQRRDAVIEDMNETMDFHEIPMRFEAGKVYVQSEKLWNDPPFGGTKGDPVSRKCGNSLKLCQKWFDEEAGRNMDVPSLDLYFCVFPDWYFAGCGGLAMTTVDVAFVGTRGFLDEDTIGIHHELTHNLGCSHLTEFCFTNYKQFHDATHITIKTLMGGGGGCSTDNDDDETKRVKLFADAEKSYCETPNTCLLLGSEEADCAGLVLKELEHDVNAIPKQMCTRKNTPDYRGPFCLQEAAATCEGATRILKDEVSSYLECAERILANPELCPTGLFSFYRMISSKGGIRVKYYYCMCCPKKRYKSVPKKISMLYKVIPDKTSAAMDEAAALTMQVPDVHRPTSSLEDGVVFIFAAIGLSFTLWLGASKLRGKTQHTADVFVEDL
jgi:hypothetical protein